MMISVRHVGFDQAWLGVKDRRAFIVVPSGRRYDVVEGHQIDVRPGAKPYLDELLTDLPRVAQHVVVTEWPPPHKWRRRW